MRFPQNQSYFAQATQAPNNGASNATDFQPTTRNPQTAPGNLQPVGSSQEASSQDILNRQNTRITVPVNPKDAPLPQQAVSGGINWVVVVISTVVIVAVLYYVLALRDKRKAATTGGQAPVAIPEPEAATVSAATSEEPTPKKSNPTAVSAAKKPKKKKSKSKSKRKHR